MSLVKAGFVFNRGALGTRELRFKGADRKGKGMTTTEDAAVHAALRLDESMRPGLLGEVAEELIFALGGGWHAEPWYEPLGRELVRWLGVSDDFLSEDAPVLLRNAAEAMSRRDYLLRLQRERNAGMSENHARPDEVVTGPPCPECGRELVMVVGGRLDEYVHPPDCGVCLVHPSEL